MRTSLKICIAVLSVTLLTGAFSVQNVYGQAPTPPNVSDEASVLEKISHLEQYVLYGAGEELAYIPEFYNNFSKLQNFLQILYRGVDVFLSNNENLPGLSEVLHTLISALGEPSVIAIGFDYKPTGCTYYHYERREACPGPCVAKKLIEITALISSLINLHQQIQSQPKALDFARQLDDALSQPGVIGLISYLIYNRNKISKETTIQITELLKQLDNNSNHFLNSYKNIVNLDEGLWELISAIDIYQIDSYGNKTFFYPNYNLANTLLETTNKIYSLVKNRRLFANEV